MSTDKMIRVAVSVFIAALAALLIWFGVPYIVPLILPFIIAYVIAKMIEPAVKFLNGRLKFPRKAASLILVVLALFLLGFLLALLISKIVEEVRYFYDNWEAIWNSIIDFSENTEDYLAPYISRDIAEFISDGLNKIELADVSKTVMKYAGQTMHWTINFATALPSVLVSVIVLVMATFFFSSDKSTLSVHRLLPKSASKYVAVVSKNITFALGGYLKAQGILILITFSELLIGFLIIGGSTQKYAFILALIISIIDAIPILGTGTVLIPWAVYSFLLGDVKAGVSLLIIYGICLIVRQISEPRIMSKRIGVHPLATLFAMYVGLRIWGIFGMILGPVIALVIKALKDEGVFKKIKDYILG